MKEVTSSQVVEARGLTGDRYAAGQGAFQKGKSAPDPKQAITLIEVESLDAVARDFQLSVSHAESRRNLLTQGVPLNHLVGQRFWVGDVVLEGVELCEPCSHLEKLNFQGLKKALVHRGGLRAMVITGGTITSGDAIRSDDS